MVITRPHSDRILAGVAICAISASLLLVGWATSRWFTSMIEERRLIVHSLQVVSSTSLVMGMIAEAEAAQRDCLIRPDSDSIVRYRDSVQNILPAFDRLANLIEASPSMPSVGLLKQAISAEIEVLSASLRMQTAGEHEQACRAVTSKEHVKKLRALTQSLERLKNEQEHLLSLQAESLEQKTQQTYLTLTASVVALFLLLGSAYAVILVMRKQRERRVLEQRIIYAVSSVVSRPATLPEIIQEIMRSICTEFRWQIGAFWQPDATGEALRCVQFFALIDAPELESISLKISFEKGRGLPGRIWESAEPAWIQSLSDDANFPRIKEAVRDGLRAGFGFPVLAGGRFLGVFEFYAERIQKPDQQLLQAFDVVKSEIGQMIERRYAEERLALSLHDLDEAKTVLDRVLESMGSGVVVADRDGKFLLFNEAAKSMLGLGPIPEARSEWPSKYGVFLEDQATLCPVDDLPLVRALNGESIDDVVLFCKNVSVPKGIWLSFNGRPLRTSEGKSFGGVVVFEDISNRREAERRVSEFYSTVSHELRTPLTSIRGALGLLEGGKAGELSPKAQGLVCLGRTECDRLIRLINDILDIRKIEAGKLELKLQLLEPLSLLQRTRESLFSLAADKSLVLRSTVKTNKCVYADEDKAVQVLTNLVSNAIKFSPPGASIVLEVDDGNADMVRFSVVDSGPGISKHDQARLFNVFEQLDSTDSRPQGGTGLGLAISKSLVTGHGGNIGVESQEGKGSTFWFELPCKLVLDGTPGGERQKLRAENKSVLVIEDDQTIAEVMCVTLGDEGYSVMHAASLSEARAALAANEYDAIVLDVGLDANKNLQVVSSLEQRGTPIVVVSARSKSETFTRPFLIDWIGKPYDAARLLNSIELATKKRPQGLATVLLVEDDATTRAILRQQIEALPVTLFEAGTGKDAIEMARDISPDLIILDIGLPDIDGFEVVAACKKELNTRNNPLIVYTARDVSDRDREKLQLGLTSYLTKARATEDEFLTSIRGLLKDLLVERS